MGYDVHITRAKHWTDSESDPISIDHWLAYERHDPEMRWDGFAEASTPDGDVIRVESPGLSVWTGFSGHNVSGNMAWFDWHRGRIIVKNPGQEIISKMKRIAVYFGAKVQGDDGELY